ncbi:hypothetical protein D9758_004509 [Tetrapyrgos nigripes]|uniref:Cytochrome P450 n=1 Tax=Tetrapyrgos nigripes TaxID=182062 RepID=A0A8H5LSP9_9AGAR|nr:hypothetical protein D9758_004509 [Tetrapyrgos nigripes]
MSVPIPQPPRIPFIGNVAQLDTTVPLNGFVLLAKQYGEIFKIDILGRPIISINTYALQQELCDQKKFRKYLGGAMVQARVLGGDGLFTAFDDEPNWGIAHRLLTPAFNAVAIRDMFDDMQDLTDQLLLKWERFGPEHIIDPSEDYTKATLDILALCTMSLRLNSFYNEEPPRFGSAVSEFLKECFLRSARPSLLQAVMTSSSRKFEELRQYLWGIPSDSMSIPILLSFVFGVIKTDCAVVLKDRRANPTDKKDLLNTMLNSADPKTGARLNDDSIIKNLLTFLVAGHETSSGTLSFMTYYVIKNPEVWRKLQNEVDEVTGGQRLQYSHLGRFSFLEACMRETLRLAPAAPMRTVAPYEDTVIGGGKYFLPANTPCLIQTFTTQRDPAVWGADANEFRPERMMDGKFEKYPPNAFQAPCLYWSAIRLQEMKMIMACVVQKFDLSFIDPSYTLEIQQGLSIKPKDLRIRARPRTSGPRLYATPSYSMPQNKSTQSKSSNRAGPAIQADKLVPMYVLYGSNTGTSEAFAQRIASAAATYGFAAKLGTLDSATGNLPTDGPVVIVTASYEGLPADNAAQFVDWLGSLKSNELKGVRFALFGCGHSDWDRTLHKIPLLCDQLMASHGAERLMKTGLGLSGAQDFFEVFDQFEADLWKALTTKYTVTQSQSSTSIGFDIEIIDTVASRADTLNQPDAALGTVKENKVLTQPGHPVKRHIEFELPEGLTYRAGDYLSILPQNPPRDVQRVLARFNLSEKQMVVLSSIGPTSLPTDQPVSLYDVLLGYVELSQPATTQDLRIMMGVATTDSTRAALKEMRSSYQAKILAPRLSVLDILEKYPSSDINLPLGVFLRLLPPMRVRQYSISSSPLWNPQHATLSISVLESPSLADKNKIFLGVGSNYLSQLNPGDRVQISVRESHGGFHPPEDPSTPIIAFGAGSGLAPLRGFIQERALQKSSGRNVGKILLFFGCRDPEGDYIYKKQLDEWVKLGVLDIRPAFSRDPAKSDGCKYVQDRLWNDRDDVTDLFDDNAQVFICGSSRVAKGVMSKWAEILRSNDPTLSAEDAMKRLEETMQGRYATDVFDA